MIYSVGTAPGQGDGMLRAALAYARLGWPVFPCQPGEKVPATAHGFLDAGTDPGQITAWWSRVPDRNVAIATGAPGPDVLDVDVRPAGSGFAAFNMLKRAGLIGVPGAVVLTPSSGMHVYYRGSAQRSGHVTARQLDFRARGGYVLAPPSVVAGRPYLLVSRPGGDCVLDWASARELLDPRPLPRPLAAGQARADWHPEHLVAWVAGQPEGNRNNGLFWAASRAIEAGRPDALAELARAAQAAGLSAVEANRTVRSAARHAARLRTSAHANDERPD